jgi:hypothetical protein
VLTDGKENRSKHRLEDVLPGARKLGISIYTIGLGEEINPDMLKNIALNTEGNYYHAARPADLIKIYERVSQLLHSQFLIEFESPLPMDDNWHQLHVEITYNEGVVKGKRSYLSAKESFIPTKWLKAIKANELKRIEEQKKRLQEAIQKETKISHKHEDNLIVFLSIMLGILVLLLLILILFKKRR